MKYYRSKLLKNHKKAIRIMREEIKNFILFPPVFNVLVSLSPDQIKALMPTMAGLITEEILNQLINEIKEGF